MTCAQHWTWYGGRKNIPGPVPVLKEIMIMTNVWKQRTLLCDKLATLFNTHIPCSSHHFWPLRTHRLEAPRLLEYIVAPAHSCWVFILSQYPGDLHAERKWPRWGSQSCVQNQTHTYFWYHASLTPHSWLPPVLERHRGGGDSDPDGFNFKSL